MNDALQGSPANVDAKISSLKLNVNGSSLSVTPFISGVLIYMEKKFDHFFSPL